MSSLELPAVFTHVKSGGHFGRWVRIPARRDPRRYKVTARCGGGNLGVTRHLRVVAPGLSDLTNQALRPSGPLSPARVG